MQRHQKQESGNRANCSPSRRTEPAAARREEQSQLQPVEKNKPRNRTRPGGGRPTANAGTQQPSGLSLHHMRVIGRARERGVWREGHSMGDWRSCTTACETPLSRRPRQKKHFCTLANCSPWSSRHDTVDKDEPGCPQSHCQDMTGHVKLYF